MTPSQESSEYEPSQNLLQNVQHTITLTVNSQNSYIYLECSTRLALREFALSLLDEANCGTGWQEFYYLAAQGGPALVVNGARFTPESSRLFVSILEQAKNE